MIADIESSRTTLHRWASLGATLALVCRSQAALAAPSPRSLHDTVHVRRGATCIDEPALLEQVRSWLDADAVEGDLRVDVEGSSSDERFVSFRIWRGDRLIAQRSFAPGPAQCEQMHAVLGLAIALALKVSLHDELFGPPPPRPPPPGPVVPQPPGKWSVGVGTSLGWNVIPGLSGGGVLWVEKSFSQHFSAHLELSELASGGEGFQRVAGEFSSSSVAFEAGACAVPSLGKGLNCRLCLGLEGRVLFASGGGFAVSKDATLGWLSISNAAGVSVALAPSWSLVGSVGLVVPLQRVQIAVVEPGGSVVETRDLGAAGGLLSFGVAYEF
jgi:hypothetical protein